MSEGQEDVAWKELNKSEFVERFLELSLFYRLFSPLDSEMICIKCIQKHAHSFKVIYKS